jgi:tripartite-type tricarboxylate transporter receptor subunit TctC
MQIRRMTLGLLSGLIAALAAMPAPAPAQDYPNRPVRIISDSAPGSAVDVTVRIVAERLGKIWGQQVITANHPGAGGSISARVASEAAPDGYTFYMPALSVFLPSPGRAANLPLQVPRDFVPLGFVSQQPMFIGASPKLGIATIPELIALAKQKPGELSYAVTGVGRLTHLTGELLQMRAGIKLLMVPYSGGPSHAISDVIGGRVPLAIEGYAGLASAFQGGSLKALGTGAGQRLADFPNLPTVAETLPGFNAVGWQVLVAPVGTPETIARKVSEDLRKAMSHKEVQAVLAKRGSYTRPMSAAETLAFIRAEQKQWEPVFRQLNLKK